MADLSVRETRGPREARTATDGRDRDKPKHPVYNVSKEPITSYGIIMFYRDSKDQLWYLISQRRDSIEYTDFLRGKYTRSNLETYFNLMTIDERKRLLSYSFKELWDDLWVNHNTKFYREVFPKARQRFEQIKDSIPAIIENTTSIIKEPEWGFPKGKKNIREEEIQCAIREFREETKLTIDYRNIIGMSPSVETFKGSNNKLYSTVYYIAQTKALLPIHKIDINGIRKKTVSEEISNLCWVTLRDARRLLHDRRYLLLAETEKKVRSTLDAR